MVKNVVIIGAGPAGEAAAKALRNLGGAGSDGGDLNITLIEKEAPGGLCLNKGCIPSKTLLEHIHTLTRAHHPINWKELQAAKTAVVQKIQGQIYSTLKTQKITYRQGLARFENKNSVSISNGSATPEILSFDKAIITTGTTVYYPEPLNQFKDQLLNSDKILDLQETPKSIVIVGGGAVGLEFACLLNAVGTAVTVIELKPTILPGEDENVISTLTRIFEARGIKIITGVAVKALKKTGTGWDLTLTNGEALQTAEVLACVGRIPDPDSLHLEKAFVKVNQKKIVINEQLQTSNPDVYAAGDATTATRLAHAAAAQAEVAAANILGEKQIFDDTFVPRCLYTWPEVASVGAWKYQLEEKGQAIKVTRAFYQGSAKAMAADETDGFVQIVSDASSKKILGAQIIGAHATELIHIFSVALKAKMTTKELGEVMFAHPTLAEMIKEACKKAG